MNMERKTGLMNKKYVSPCFLPGMRLGNIMFTLAAACAHARTVGVECRVPWAYNDASLMLRSRLGGWVLPSTPVSYTHLDVYKRQVLHFLDGNISLLRQIEELHSIKKRKSYRILPPMKDALPFPMITEKERAVSYTHLDVYKRQWRRCLCPAGNGGRRLRRAL